MNAPAKPPSLRSHGIAKAFTVGKVTQQVIRDSSLDIYPGELTLIVGPSGSGKSTLLSMLSGLLRPDAGQVLALAAEAIEGPRAEAGAAELLGAGVHHDLGRGVVDGLGLHGADQTEIIRESGGVG